MDGSRCVLMLWYVAQAELEELDTAKDNTLEPVRDDSRADIQVRYVPVYWLLHREVAHFPLYCSFTWQRCVLVNYMLLCVDLTWSEHGTCSTLQNMCPYINIIVTWLTVKVVLCKRTVCRIVWNKSTNIVATRGHIWLELCGTISSVGVTVYCTVHCQGCTTLLIAAVYWPYSRIICLIVMKLRVVSI
jgi:hypothetical protein